MVPSQLSGLLQIWAGGAIITDGFQSFFCKMVLLKTHQ